MARAGAAARKRRKTIEGYGSAVFWLETAPATPDPPLDREIIADVCIVGGGFTGLWTAFELKAADPSLKIALVEGDEIAHGASGRNGGFAMTLLDMSLHLFAKNVGNAAAAAAHNAVAESVTEIGRICDEREIECDYTHGGLLSVATNEAQEVRVRQDLETAAELGLRGVTPLSGDELRDLVHSPTYLSGMREEACAVLNPAKLARGLKRVVKEMAVDVYEESQVTGFESEPGGKFRVSTPEGAVLADQVVLAVNAWTARLPELARKVMPLYTYIVLTEPLDDDQVASVGWDERQGIEDKRNYVHYYRMTADNRILWGGTDGVIYRDLGIRPKYDRNERVFSKLEATFRRTFPQLSEVRFTHRWGGPVAVTVNFIPMFGTLPGGGIHYGCGYNGHGVAPSHTGGRILSDLVLNRDRGYRDLCFVKGRKLTFPPNPVAWIGAELTRKALLKQDRDMDAGKAGGEMDPALLRAFKRLS